jgi:hypothetical protein
MLMASLPPHPMSLWNNKNKPITRLHLEKRLTLLNDADRQQLAAIEGILHWAKMHEADSDALIVVEAEQVIQSIDNPLLQSVISWRMELRTVVAAIRRRELGTDAPAKNTRWGYGEVVSLIRQHWQADDFGCRHRFPWVQEANALFVSEQSVALEQLLLNLSWQHYERIGHGHYFDFEAIVIYVLRWNIVNRWVQCDKQAAMRQFEILVNEGLGEFLTTR